MENKNQKSDSYSRLRSLGCAYYTKLPHVPVDPEVAIIEMLKDYWDFKDHFFMLYSLLKHRLHDLIHVEKLVANALEANLPQDQIILLIALSNKMVELGDRRFALVGKKFHKNGMQMQNPPNRETDSYLIKNWGIEKTLVPYGAKVRSFYEEEPKKMYVLKRILSEHPWLRLRALIGANYRADIVYLRSNGNVETAYQAAKLTGCSIGTAYRLWTSLDDVENLKGLVG